MPITYSVFQLPPPPAVGPGDPPRTSVRVTTVSRRADEAWDRGARIHRWLCNGGDRPMTNVTLGTTPDFRVMAIAALRGPAWGPEISEQTKATTISFDAIWCPAADFVQ